jgi:hypothetical protein
MITWSRVVCAASGIVSLASIACGSSSAETAGGFGGGDDGGTAPGYDAGSGMPLGDDGSGPPEKKVEGDYQSPVATGKYVWIANPTSGRVAYVDATAMDVHTVQAGDAPTYLAAVPDPKDDVAIVLNVLSHDATLLRASGSTLATRFFPVAVDVNAWAVSGDGRWAIAWGDATKATNPDPTEGFQDISVLDLTAQRQPANLSVGYRPVKVAFSGDGKRAFAVTQDGVSVVDLSGGTSAAVTKNFPVSGDPNDDPGTRDVSITGDGAYALVRRDGKSDITVVSLADGTLTTVRLPAAATDLDLSPDGTAALVVMRDISQVALLPLPGIATNPGAFSTVSIAGETVGRGIVTDDGKSALLFTTVLPVDRLTVLSLGTTPSFRTVRLYAPLLAVFPTHDAAEAVVLHQIAPDAGTTAKGAFSLVPIASQLPAKIVGTQAPPNAVALSPASDRAVVTVRDDASSTWAAYLARMPSLEVDEYPLATPPIAAGVVAGAGRAWIAQSHPEGRITFIDLASGEARTLTGFELGSRVVEGSQP